MAPETAPQGQSLIEFLNTVPAPIVTVLVGLGAPIAAVRRALEVVSWKAPWTDSWLLVAAWWAACLFAQPALRYALPLTVAAWVAWRQWRPRKAPPPPPPVAETTLQMSISDLTTINTLLPRKRAHRRSSVSTSSPEPGPSVPEHPETLPSPDFKLLLRLAGLLTLPYLVLTYIIGLRVILGLVGTVVLTYRAPWASHLRAALWRSAHIRFACYRAWAFLSGRPLPAHLGSPGVIARSLQIASADKTVADDKAPEPAPEVKFLFTVHENQRWWMGLDWTAALLPGERPSWCSPSLHAVSPPAAFALPPPTVVFMPIGSASSTATSSRSSFDSGRLSSDSDAGQMRVKRTATWRWAEPEWRVLIRPSATAPSARIERPLPSTTDPETQSSGSRIFNKAAARMRGESGGAAIGHPKEASGETDGEKGSKPNDGAREEEEPVTDGDGWVYADNKWEGQTGKGGMGKYTRYRRWTRIAVLSETVELVGPGETGVVPGIHSATRPRTESRANGQTPGAVKTQPHASPSMNASSLPSSPTAKSFPVKEDRWDNSLAKKEEPAEKEDAAGLLRQRLRAAVKGQSAPA